MTSCWTKSRGESPLKNKRRGTAWCGGGVGNSPAVILLREISMELGGQVLAAPPRVEPPKLPARVPPLVRYPFLTQSRVASSAPEKRSII